MTTRRRRGFEYPCGCVLVALARSGRGGLVVFRCREYCVSAAELIATCALVSVPLRVIDGRVT